MGTQTFDVAAFRAAFPVFANETMYSDAMLQMYWIMATMYISDEDFPEGLNGPQLVLVLQLMTAHLTWLNKLISSGRTPSVKTASSIDKISVTLLPPPIKDGWDWWLNTTPYGQQLNAILSLLSVGGFSVGGSPERDGFRRVGGGFGPWGQ